ncbi:AMP-binding protein, partial [Rhizobiaceae sp. 2RAB30]
MRPTHSTYELLRRAWEFERDRVAVTFLPTGDPDEGDVRVTRGEMLSQLHRTANFLRAIGVGDRDSVATLLPSGPDALAVIYGAQAAGIATPLNPLLGIAELEHLVRLAGSRVLVASTDPGLDIGEKATEIARRVPGLRLFGIGPQIADAEDFNAACAPFRGEALQFDRVIRPTDIAAYMHTGGTTGRPKLAAIKHDNFVYGAWAQSRSWDFDAPDVILSALPLFHVSGLATLATVPFSVGAEVVILSASGFRNPKIVQNFWRIVEKYRGSFSAFVPTIAATLAAMPSRDTDISSLRTIMIGGAAAPVDTVRRLKAVMPANIVVTFGQTESLVGTGNRPGHEVGPMSSGPISPLMQIAIRSGGRDVPAGDVGEILLKGPAVFDGYKGRPAIEGFTPDGWLVTGDIGWLDADGCLVVTGRSKDLIIRSGHNIDPRAIEEAGASHPAVAACAAVGAPDRYAGELPVLYVALHQGSDASPAELAQWVAARVPERPAAPKQVHILPSLPMTAVGKIYKPALRIDAVERVVRRELTELASKGAITGMSARLDEKRGIVVELAPGPGWPAGKIAAQAEELLAGLLFHTQIVNSPA